MVAFENARNLMPEIYGDHLTVAGDPDQQVQHIVHRIDWASLSDEEIEAIEMFARATERTFAERRRTGARCAGSGHSYLSNGADVARAATAEMRVRHVSCQPTP